MNYNKKHVSNASKTILLTSLVVKQDNKKQVQTINACTC